MCLFVLFSTSITRERVCMFLKDVYVHTNARCD